MNRTTFRAILVVIGLLIVVGFIMNSQRDQRARVHTDTADAVEQLRLSVEGCGRGTGRWGGTIHELRDNATGRVLSRNLSLDNGPDVGESEAVLRAWFDCHRTVDQDQHEVVYESDKEEGRYYSTGRGGTGYSVQNGRISCIKVGDTASRCTPWKK
jgi:hypothetical protein